MVEFEFRPFTTLSDEEKSFLTEELTLPPRLPGQPRMSLFARWLRHPVPTLMYAVLVKMNSEIVGWVAISLGEGINWGIVGAYIREGYRGNGYARKALHILLPNVRALYPDWYDYIYYQEGHELLFREIVESSGFRDSSLHKDEYKARYSHITGG
jgi:RimJ/RimL family protein N-acetyltransferase